MFWHGKNCPLGPAECKINLKGRTMRKPIRDADDLDAEQHGHTPGSLLALAYAWSNLSKKQLVDAGVIGEGAGGSDWKRFNDDPMTFIMKLPPERLPALCALLN